MKKQRKVEKDNRGVAIYARKSRITNKGDSIGVQFKQCADYAKKELGLDEEYEFLQYEDKRSVGGTGALSSLRQAIECDFRVRPLDERKTSIQICLSRLSQKGM